MKNKFKIFLIFMVLIFVFSNIVNGQSDREWWDNLSPAWKKVFQDQELKGKDIEPNDQMLERIVRVTHIDCSENKEIKNLRPLSRLILLEEIRCEHTNIESLEGIENLTNLKILDCSDNDNINDLTPLISLTSLIELDCSNTMVKNLAPLQSLKNLKILDVHLCTVNKILQISQLTQLEVLDVSQNNSLYDIIGIEGLKNIVEFNCSDTKVRDLKPISNLRSLRYLDISKTSVESLRHLQELNGLVELNFSDNNIRVHSLDYLYSHISLKMLRARNIQATEKEIESFKTPYLKRNPNCTILMTPAI